MALSSFYEGDQDPIADEDDDGVGDDEPPQALGHDANAVFGELAKESNKGDKASSNKDKSKKTAGGARIMTLNNMSSDEEEDDGTGQVGYLSIILLFISI